jgi:putative membrane protein
MMHWGQYGWGMGIFMILFWVFVIFGIVYVILAVSKRDGNAGKGETLLDILKKRYAKGEITKEQFEHMKDDLMKS